MNKPIDTPDYELALCPICCQMTNHLNGICSKHNNLDPISGDIGAYFKAYPSEGKDVIMEGFEKAFGKLTPTPSQADEPKLVKVPANYAEVCIGTKNCGHVYHMMVGVSPIMLDDPAELTKSKKEQSDGNTNN
jgi:hypothetical protein